MHDSLEFLDFIFIIFWDIFRSILELWLSFWSEVHYNSLYGSGGMTCCISYCFFLLVIIFSKFDFCFLLISGWLMRIITNTNLPSILFYTLFSMFCQMSLLKPPKRSIGFFRILDVIMISLLPVTCNIVLLSHWHCILCILVECFTSWIGNISCTGTLSNILFLMSVVPPAFSPYLVNKQNYKNK